MGKVVNSQPMYQVMSHKLNHDGFATAESNNMALYKSRNDFCKGAQVGG